MRYILIAMCLLLSCNTDYTVEYKRTKNPAEIEKPDFSFIDTFDYKIIENKVISGKYKISIDEKLNIIILELEENRENFLERCSSYFVQEEDSLTYNIQYNVLFHSSVIEECEHLIKTKIGVNNSNLTYVIIGKSQFSDFVTSLPELNKLHKIQLGETLSSIALEYNTTKDSLLSLNPGISSALNPGTTIRIYE